MPAFPEVARTEANFDVRANLSENRLQGLWRLLQGFRLRYIGANVTLGLAALSNTLSLLLLQQLVDRVLQNPPEDLLGGLLAVAGIFVGLTVLRGTFSFFSGALAAEVAEGVALRLRDFMFDHLQHLHFTYHDKAKTGDLIQRSTSDIDAVRRFFAEQAIGIGRIVILFSVNFGALLLLHAPLAIFTVLVVPIVVVNSLFFFRRVSKAYEAYQEQDGVLSNVLQENLTGVRVVKAFARQDFEIARFEKENAEKFRLGKRFMMMHASYWPVVDLMTGFQQVAGFLLGAMLVIMGEITLGTYISYAAMVGWIINPMRELGRLIVQISEGMVSYDRLSKVIHETWEDLGRSQPIPREDVHGHIVFRNVGFEYEPGQPVLEDISFEVQPGQTVALLGSTGSGKTTLMALLTRFYDYTAGEILLDGVPLTEYPRYYLRELVGLVEQEPFLFSRTIRENITYGAHREVSEDEVFRAARAAAAHDFIVEFPDGYETAVGERGVTVSGGQKQRIALARTLLKNPRILVLDDATSSVDTQTESEIREALEDLMEKRTSFIIAHRIQSVMGADLILVLDKGHIVQRGTHDELMRQEGIYRRTYDMQARIETELESELAGVGSIL